MRVAFARPGADGGARLVLDPRRRLPGRGAYVHAKPGCVTAPGLARSLRRTVTPADVQRLVSEMSPSGDSCGGPDAPNASAIKSLGDDPTGQIGSGLNVRETVEIPSTAEQRTTGV